MPSINTIDAPGSSVALEFVEVDERCQRHIFSLCNRARLPAVL